MKTACGPPHHSGSKSGLQDWRQIIEKLAK